MRANKSAIVVTRSLMNYSLCRSCEIYIKHKAGNTFMVAHNILARTSTYADWVCIRPFSRFALFKFVDFCGSRFSFQCFPVCPNLRHPSCQRKIIGPIVRFIYFVEFISDVKPLVAPQKSIKLLLAARQTPANGLSHFDEMPFFVARESVAIIEFWVILIW